MIEIKCYDSKFYFIIKNIRLGHQYCKNCFGPPLRHVTLPQRHGSGKSASWLEPPFRRDQNWYVTRINFSRVLIPRINLIPSDESMLIKFMWRQFPLLVSFAMTINKSQEQTLTHVGVYLLNPVFSHRQ